jgi:drug/metabolite transporter (DMT)-like permease
MATVSPIAAVAVLPLAITNGDTIGMSSTGWIYTLILTFLTGVAAHGLMVFAQETISIGTIGITQVIQPPLAFVWSFLILDERLNGMQIVGITIVLSGLLAFLLVNQHANHAIAQHAPSNPEQKP